MNFAQTQSQEFPNGRRRRELATDELTGQTFEKYVVEVKQVGNEKLEDFSEFEYYEESYDDDSDEGEMIPRAENYPKVKNEELTDTSGTRWLLYDGLGKLLYSKGMQGRPCVLRGICEAADAKFTHHTGLLGELVHIALT